MEEYKYFDSKTLLSRALNSSGSKLSSVGFIELHLKVFACPTRKIGMVILCPIKIFRVCKGKLQLH